MITKFDKKLQKEYDSIAWESYVKRPGFLQSKVIVTQAELIYLKLTSSVTLKYISQFWIKDADTYDKADGPKLAKKIEAAFKENKKWPLNLIKEMDGYTKESHLFVESLQRNWKIASKNEKIAGFKKYVELLKNVQKYYAVIMPLMEFCESKLQAEFPELREFAFPFKSLEVDDMAESLRLINSSPKNKQAMLIKNHLNKFGWIKTAYNIIGTYTEKDVREELKNLSGTKRSTKTTGPDNYLLTGLQVGIYLRNHLKELAQQLWFHIEPLAQQLSKDFGISRDDFYQMHPEEVLESVRKGKLVVSRQVFKDRKSGYAYGYLKGREVLLTGSIVEKLYARIKDSTDATAEIKGQVAFRGLVKGRVKIILKHSEFNKLQKGEILVTNMTTPDFIVILKKAAAIVTDEGGLSCHAAIVSREFEIPCIIGTKNATKVLKDGDLVEVDANKGIVRKI